ncbi:MAG: cation diffusion facilitator family transporter [Pseudomonadota bacterium]
MPHEACPTTVEGTAARSEARLAGAFALISGFMVVEVAGGLYSGSLALLADAAHMALDAVALGAALLAARIDRAVGGGRARRWAAMFNAATLLPLCAWMTGEAVERLREPEPVLAGWMFAVAVAGLVVNLVAFRLLHDADASDQNVRAAALHVLGDILGSIAAIVAALIIALSGWTAIDPILSFAVAGLVAVAASRVLWRVARTGA